MKSRETKQPEKKKIKLWKKIIIVIVVIITVTFCSILFLLYGPYPNFREWLITTAMTTMNHKYYAKWFYSDKTIEEVLSRNKVIEVDEYTNPLLIEETKQTEYANKYDKEILERNVDDDYKIIRVDGREYRGYLAVIYDPSRIKTVVTENVGEEGEYLETMAQRNDAILAINGGGFKDPNYSSNGAMPIGITISNGKVITNSEEKDRGLIGFTEDNKLILGKMTLEEAKKLKIRDAVTYGPNLIVNGKPSKILGNGGWGIAPRTAIGQRKDGIVLFLVIDGRSISSRGATMIDLLEIMQKYGAYNAANLDGGTSSVMIENNKIINNPIDSTGAHRTRKIATGFILTRNH